MSPGARHHSASPPGQFACTATIPTGGVLLSKSRSYKAGTLLADVRCNEDADLTVSATLVVTARKPRHGKARTRTYSLGPLQDSVKAGRRARLLFKVPGTALGMLRNGAAEEVTLRVEASNSTTTGGDTSTAEG